MKFHCKLKANVADYGLWIMGATSIYNFKGDCTKFLVLFSSV